MKKILSLFIVGFLLVGCSEKDAKKTGWERDNLEGKVKSITETIYKAVEKSGKVQKVSLSKKYSYKYDNNGNKTESTNYLSNGSLLYKLKYIYDINGNKIQETEHNSDDSLVCKTTNEEYDSNGNWTKEIRFETKNKTWKIPPHIIERKIEYYD